MSKLVELCRNLDGAKYVRYVDDMELLFVWHGGHGIHVLNPEGGEEVELYNVGDFGREEATLDEVVQGVQEILDYYREVN